MREIYFGVGSNSWRMVEAADAGWSCPKATFINLAPFKVRDWSNLGLNLNISLFKHFLPLNTHYLLDLNLNLNLNLNISMSMNTDSLVDTVFNIQLQLSLKKYKLSRYELILQWVILWWIVCWWFHPDLQTYCPDSIWLCALHCGKVHFLVIPTWKKLKKK